MTIRFLVLLLFWAPLAADAGAMGIDDARHLLGRVAFGGDPDSLRHFAGLTREAAVNELLGGLRTEAVIEDPEWFGKPLPPQVRKEPGMSEEERRKKQQELRRMRNQRAQELKAWWYQEMAESESPFTERLTLFWHNHFTSGMRKVRSPELMLKQNKLLRQHAAGNFGKLLHAVSQDPAMVLYLDNQTNNKKKPNENYARELMELFTLGEENYTENDIKEAARAFTGWKVNRRTGEFRFVRQQHDTGTKVFFGNKGKFGGHEILEIILEQNRVAVFITEKLWRAFVSDTPDPQEVQHLAQVFRQNDYELKPLLRDLLTSKHFWSPQNRAQLVKSPVELLVGTLRMFAAPVTNYGFLVTRGRALGQDLLDPPNVKGWPGGTAWISTNTLLLRETLLASIISGEAISMDRPKRRPRMNDKSRKRDMMRGKSVSLKAWLAGLGESDQQRGDTARRMLLPRDAVQTPDKELPVSRQVAQLLRDPSYQLK